MKNVYLALISLSSISAMGQFDINIKTEGLEVGKEIYIYTLDGSKDILYSKEITSKNGVSLKYKKEYKGMMKAYLPDYHYTIPFISENKNVNISVEVENNRPKKIIYQDVANQTMDALQNHSRKKEYILPALQQIYEYYSPSDEFAVALSKEINQIFKGNNMDTSAFPFINFYKTNNETFVQRVNSEISSEKIIDFLSSSNEMLETSGLLRPIILTYLNLKTSSNTEEAVSKLLTAVNLETSRGQTVLSELIDIFDVYSMNNLKEKYLTEAQNLKCSINNRLSNTIALNKSLQIGAKLENSVFKNPVNTSAKSIYDIKADKKILVFWSSGCSHCDKELPQFIPIYNTLKSKNIEIIGLSFDSDKMAYQQKANNYPWISASELNGWYSNYSKKYNVQATPSYIIIDSQNKIIAKPNNFKEAIDFLQIK